MTKYLSKFIAGLSKLTTPLNDLLKKQAECIWTHEYAKAFQLIKGRIAGATILAYFDVNKPVTVTCDASQSSLGAAAPPNDKVVSYASRAMETNRD